MTASPASPSLPWYVCTPLRGRAGQGGLRRAAAVLGRLAASRSLGLLSASQFFTNVGWVFIMTWAPRYFQSVHQLPVEERALLVSIPPLVGWFGTVLGGMWTDYLLRTVGVRWSRALPIGLSRLLAVFAYLAFLFEPSPWVAVVLFSLVAFLTDWSQGTVWAFCQDIGGRHVASVLGWSNMWGNFGAAITPPLLIWIVGPSQNWVAAFLACAAAFLLAGLTGLGIDATKPIAAAEGQGRGERGRTKRTFPRIMISRQPRLAIVTNSCQEKSLMIRCSVLPVVISCGLFCGMPSVLWAQVQSVDQAVQLSQATGRPIFALAGSKT